MLRWIKERLASRSARVFGAIDAHNKALDRLMRVCSNDDRSVEDFFELVSKIAADALTVERVSVWRFTSDRGALECMELYTRSTGKHSSGMTLRRESFRKYFDACLLERVVAATDAETDRRTAAFTESYLRPNNIVSMLDSQIRSTAGPRGVVCIESVGERRAWTPAEIAFAKSIAELVGFALDRADRQSEQQRLEEANRNLVESERRLNDFAEQLPGAVFRYSVHPDGREEIDLMNPGCEELWELSRDEIGSDPAAVWALTHPDDSDALRASVDRSAEGLRQWTHRFRITTPSGAEKWLQGRGRPSRDKDGVVRFNSIIFDVTEQIRWEKALEAANAELEASEIRRVNAIDALPDAFVIYDKDDRLVVCNKQYRRLYAEAADLIVPGARFEDIIRACAYRGMHPQAVGREEEWVAERLAQHLDPQGVIEQELPGDRHLQIHERRAENGDIVGCRVDVTELKRQQRRLEELADALRASKSRAEHEALHDPLTGLPNRRHLDQEIEVTELGAGDKEEVCMLHVDLDRFKHINDTLGHAAGDHVLTSVAKKLRKTVRRGDFVARIGGDEFLILCRDLCSPANMKAMARRIVKELAKPIRFRGHECRIGASVGMASARAKEASSLLVNADIALYQAKKNGRGQVVPFTSKLQAELNERKRTADQVLVGLENDAFFPVFQPQFNAQTGECVGVEALARWEHPERGVLTPFAFLDVAEELNVIDQIDRMILRKALETCDAMAKRGVSVGKVAVNASLPRLLDPNVYKDVVAHKPDGLRVAFELLETVCFDEVGEDVNWAIDQLREAGVEFEIDDFGSGRASVIGLLNISPDRFKIDRKLVAPIETCPRARSLVEAIVGMGKSLGIEATAEGVETAEQLALLREIGCDAIQGYYLARPMPAEELEAFLKAGKWPRAA